jgi:hypothetical protein
MWAAVDVNLSKDRIFSIESGMSSREVELILGGPPGNYSHIELDSEEDRHITLFQSLGKGKRDVWIGNENIALVVFSERGQVLAKYFWKRTRPRFSREILEWFIRASCGLKRETCKWTHSKVLLAIR